MCVFRILGVRVYGRRVPKSSDADDPEMVSLATLAAAPGLHNSWKTSRHGFRVSGFTALKL